MPRILHLGLGAFHRTHQAVYLQDLIDSGDASWHLASGNLRVEQPDMARVLRAQGGRYIVETVRPDGQREHRRIDAIRECIPFETGLPQLVRLAADADTRIISFTVTEAGYELDGPRAAAGQGHTLFEALQILLRERQRSGAGAITLLSCDNLRHNGDRTRAGLLQWLERSGDLALHHWVQQHTTCPNAMVDRITPRSSAELALRVATATGEADAAPVLAEHFIQWVIEDNFCHGRPAWERVGVQMVAAVPPYEEAKIRLLNATHSCIAWAGALAGHAFIHESARDARIRGFAHDYITHDAIPCLLPSPIDLPAYRDTVLDRFCNAALQDTTQRVAMDGSVKLSGFIAPTVRDRLSQGAPIDSVAMLPALLLAFLQRWQAGGLNFAHHDSGMTVQQARAICAAPDSTQAFCGDHALWGSLAGNSTLAAAIRQAGQRVRDFEADIQRQAL